MTEGFPPGAHGSDASSGLGLPRVGTVFAEYQLEGVLGRGGMSVVFRAGNARLGNKVALKVLAPELSDNDAVRERFLRESRVAASINHPNIIPIYDVGDYEGLLYIVMRCVQGNDMKALLGREGPLPLARACSIVGQVGGALHAAHQRGLIHRDIKPGNILVERVDGDRSVDHVYLADFGLMKHSQSRSGLTDTGRFVGTVDYVAPEQIQGKPVDSRADLYSLGCVLYESLTGMAPFARETDVAVLWAHVQESCPPPSFARADLPAGLDEVIARAMAKSPEDRYQTAADLVRDLRQFARAGESRIPSDVGPRHAAPSASTASVVDSGQLVPPALAAGSVEGHGEPVAKMPGRSKRSMVMVAAAVAGVVALAAAGVFALSQGSSNTVAGTKAGSGSSSGNPGQTSGAMSMGAGNPAMLTAYVQPSVWKAYHCQRHMPPMPITISATTAPMTGLLDSATCQFVPGHIAITLNLFKNDAESSQGWNTLLGPTGLVPSRAHSCNRYNLKIAGVWRHMDMHGAKEGGLKFCDLSAAGTGYIVWTVKSEATANPSQLTHSLLLSAYQSQGKPINALDWWHKCRHQLGEGTGGMVNMPMCPT